MSTKPKKPPAKRPAARGLTGKRVRAWLEKHPDFLAGEPGLLEKMQLPLDEDGAGTVSFQAYQMRQLKEDNAQLEAMFEEARRNQKLVDHALALAAEALRDRPRSIGTALQAQERRLARHYPTAGWAIRLRKEIPKVPARYRLPEHPVLGKAAKAVFRKGPQVLVDREVVALLWPRSAGNTDTVVIVPLKARSRYGILCLALSPSIDRTNDTTLLMQVANITAATIERFCESRESR